MFHVFNYWLRSRRYVTVLYAYFLYTAKLLCIHKRKRKRMFSLRELIKSPECCCFRWTAYGLVLLERVLSMGIFSQRTDQIENKKLCFCRGNVACSLECVWQKCEP